MTAAIPDSCFIPDDNQALAHAITRLAGHINAAQYRFIKLLAVLIEREAWGDGGNIKSPAHWLNYYCGIDLGAAREKVRVAKSLSSLPRIDTAFASGAISYSKVRAMTRCATPSNEEFLLQIAHHGTAQHMTTLVRKYQRHCVQANGKSLHSVSGQTDQAHYQARNLSWFYDEDGMLVINGRLPPEEGALVIKALETVMAHLIEDAPCDSPEAKNVSAETSFDAVAGTTADSAADEPGKTFPQKRADGFVAMAEHTLSSLKNGPTALAGGDRQQVVVHIEKDEMAGIGVFSNQNHICSIEDGPVISADTARRLACDAELVTVLQDRKGNILNIGRKSRTISPAMRRALLLRDHTCRFPGCSQSRFVDAHHIHHWADGGETNMDNLVLLCRHHHRLVHEMGYQIRQLHPGRFHFISPSGRLIPETMFPQFFSDGARVEEMTIEHIHETLGLAIDERTAVTRWEGEPMDYDMSVGVLMDYDEKESRITAQFAV